MDPATLREDMVDGLEHALGEPLSTAALTALRSVPRHEFVAHNPYENRATDAEGSRVLSPGMVVRLLDALDPSPDDSVLVVGAGVGYTTAALAEIVGSTNVHAVDIDRSLVHLARSNLRATGYDAVLVDCRDGAGGLPEYAPFDRILLEAASVEPPRALVDQLAPGGRLVFPQGTTAQTLVAVEPDAAADARVVDRFGPVRFRPLLVEGEQGGIERNRMRREDAEFSAQGYFAPTGWEQEWIDWDEHL
ncbi:protein-L-isoaspartate O-methyltransferase family protein [Haloferacaceae archaeon DSL9]